MPRYLDLFISSPDIASMMDRFWVDTNDNMASDHVPVILSLDAAACQISQQRESKYNYHQAKWQLFKDELETRRADLSNDDLDELNSEISQKILTSAERAIPKVGEKIYKTVLPREIIFIIKDRRKARRKARVLKTTAAKAEYNRLTGLLKRKIIEHRNKSWAQFLQKVGKNPLSSRPFWQKIKKLRKKKNNAQRIPTLCHEGQSLETSSEKAELFCSLLARTFSPNETDDDDKFTKEVESVIQEYNNNEDTSIVFLTLEEIKKVISKSKMSSSAGPDKIHNQMLNKLPKSSLEEIRGLFNKCIALKRIPEIWKTARVTMIPKKDDDKTDPNNYRPISVTSCLGKIFEKVMTNRLYTFLETNKLLTISLDFERTGGLRTTCST